MFNRPPCILQQPSEKGDDLVRYEIYDRSRFSRSRDVDLSQKNSICSEVLIADCNAEILLFKCQNQLSICRMSDACLFCNWLILLISAPLLGILLNSILGEAPVCHLFEQVLSFPRYYLVAQKMNITGPWSTSYKCSLYVPESNLKSRDTTDLSF